MMIRIFLTLFIGAFLSACSSEVTEKNNDTGAVESEAQQKLDQLFSSIDELTEDGIYVSSYYYTSDLIDSEVILIPTARIEKLQNIIDLSNEILAYEKNYDYIYITGKSDLYRVIENAEQYIAELTDGTIEDKIAERNKQQLNSLNEFIATNDTSSADDKVKTLSLNLYDIEQEFRAVHKGDDSSTIGFLMYEKVVLQVETLSYRELIEAQQKLPKIVNSIKDLRAQINELPTNISDYTEGKYWFKMRSVVEDTGRLEQLVLRFEQKLNIKINMLEKARVKNNSSAA